MDELLRFLITSEIGIYSLLGIIALFSSYRLIKSWIEKNKAYFGLEKEVSGRKFRSALTTLLLMVLLLLAEFILVTVAEVRFPGIAMIATPTIDVLSTPTFALGDMVETPEGFAQTQTVIAFTGCIPEQLEWTFPQSGDEISGSVVLKGTVNIPNLGFYRYKYRQEGREDWTPIAAGNKKVVNDSLGSNWNTELLQPGTYELSLVVSDNQNNLLQPCIIKVRVVLQ
ncbi:MAG TPA: hypothetical protein G4N92_07825 [Anaerolineae bacterium]|nr:hypothetical protein [Anaerolineae bacterium]